MKASKAVNRSKFTAKEAFDGRFTKFKPYSMGLLVSHCLDSEMPEKGIIHATSKISGRGFQGAGDAKGEQGGRGSSHGRSCSHGSFNPTQICSGPSGWFHQRQECHSYCEDLWWTEEEFFGTEFLGTRVLDRKSTRLN